MRDVVRYYVGYARNWMREARRRFMATTFVDNLCRRRFDRRNQIDEFSPVNQRMRRVWPTGR